MRLLFFYFALTISFNSYAQTREHIIKVNKELHEIFIDSVNNWSDLIQKAQTQNKFIYIYCTDTEKSGSDYLNQYIFFNKDIKNFVLSKFILLNLKMDTYHESGYMFTKVSQPFLDSLKKQFIIYQAPTHLIFSKTGKALNKQVYNLDTTEFVKYLKDVLNGKRQVYTLIEEFKEGNRKPEFIKRLIYSLRLASGELFGFQDSINVLQKFIETYPGNKLFNKDNGKIILEFAEKIDDLCFKNLFTNKNEWYEVFGKKTIDAKLIDMLYEELDFMAFEYRYRRNTNAIEQAKVDYTKKYKAYNEYDSIVFCRASTKYYYDKPNVSEFLKSIQSYLDNNENFEEKIDNVNNYSWQVFKSTDDSELLKKVLNWSAERLRKSNNALYLDTYANLLYKLGQTNEAMKYEAKAINLATGKYIEEFKSTLLKMQQNEKTW